MAGFDLTNLPIVGKVVSQIASEMSGMLKNAQDNKTKRYESANKRKVETIKATGQVVNNAGSAIESVGRAYHSVESAKSDREKAKAEMMKAQAESKKADAVLEQAKNEKSKNDHEHEKNMHDIDVKHQEVMDRQEKDYNEFCQDNDQIKVIVNDRLKTQKIYRQKLKDGSLSAADNESMQQADAKMVEIAKMILEKRK